MRLHSPELVTHLWFDDQAREAAEFCRRADGVVQDAGRDRPLLAATVGGGLCCRSIRGSVGREQNMSTLRVHAFSISLDGYWIMGRNMFDPVRGAWPDQTWKGGSGDEPPYHLPGFRNCTCSRAGIGRWRRISTRSSRWRGTSSTPHIGNLRRFAHVRVRQPHRPSGTTVRMSSP